MLYYNLLKAKGKGEVMEREKAFAFFWHKKGKIYLKRNGWKKYQEVELKDFGDYLKVVPKMKSLF